MKESRTKKESKLTRAKDAKYPQRENVCLRKRIEFLEKSLYELQEKVYPLEREIKEVREYIGMSR